MKNFRKLLKYLKPYKKWAILAPFLILFEAIMELSLPNIMANIINVGIGEKNITYIIIYVVLMLFLTIIGVLGGIGSTYYSSKTSGYMSADLRKDIFEKIGQLSFFNLDKLKTGHLITILTNDITIIGMVIIMGLRLLVRVPIILIGSLIMAILISPKLSLMLVVIVPIMLVAVIIILKKAFPRFQEMQERLDDVNTNVRENIGGIRVVKSFVREQQEIKKFQKTNLALKNTTIKAIRTITLASPIIMLLINSGIIFVLWFGGHQTMAGNMQIGDIIAFIQYLSNILAALMMACMAILLFSRSEASAIRINEVFAQENDVKDNDKHFEKEIIGKVEFRNVSFSYQGGSGDEVIHGINFTINPGEVVAIIGATGAGKTSLINLIPRFYDVSKGEVFIDDINVKDYCLEYLRSKIGVAFQQAYLFSGTIEDNIKYGNPEATLEQVEEASKIAEAHEFIIEKEEQYQAIVEQKGANLSGGQKQRISIARAILTNCNILILDDSTSAVDMKTEKKIRKNMKKQLINKTTFIVAQRISSCITADKIIVLEDGMISGIGTHQQLLNNNKIYQEIYYSQVEEGANHGK